MADSETTSSTTGPSNKKLNSTLNKLLGGIGEAYKDGPAVFNKSLYVGPSDTTQNAWAMGLDAAEAPWLSRGVDEAAGFTNDLLAGNGLTGGQKSAVSTVGNVGTGFGRIAGSGGMTDAMRRNIQLTGDATGRYGDIYDAAGDPSLTENALLDVAKGKYLNEVDPNYQAMIDRTARETSADINASMGYDGGYGSNVHVGELADQIGALRTNAAVQERNMQLGRQTDALSAIEGRRDAGTSARLAALSGELGGAAQGFGMDQQSLQNLITALSGQQGAAESGFGMEETGVGNAFAAADQLPKLFGTAQLPSSVYGAIGAAQDADASAQRAGEFEKFTRKNGADVDLLAKLSAILGGTASVSPTTTTTTQPATPWWQTALGLGLGALSMA